MPIVNFNYTVQAAMLTFFDLIQQCDLVLDFSVRTALSRLNMRDNVIILYVRQALVERREFVKMGSEEAEAANLAGNVSEVLEDHQMTVHNHLLADGPGETETVVCGCSTT